MNSIVLSGRLTKKPELRTTQSGKSLCNFSLAVNRYASDEADFIDCVCFNKVAENLCKYQDKGSMIELSGKIQNNKYVDKDGKNVYKTIICVDMINYINSAQTSVKTSKNDENDAYTDMGRRIENELPF